ncbi:MAG: phytanoyl-CoA dioxygenase family protein, partial [Alphaproteobacteria bacterium]
MTDTLIPAEAPTTTAAVTAGAGPKDAYPTRRDRERLITRREPVIFGDGQPVGDYSLTSEQMQRYAADGYLVVPDVFSREECSDLLLDVDRMANAPELRAREELIREPGSTAPRSIFSPQRFSDAFDRASRDPRIVDIIRQILASEVYIHHARVNIKQALIGKSFPWHSDFETWHAEDGLPAMRVLSAWIMLTDNTPHNGPLFVIPGSHKTFVSCAGETPDENHKTSLRKQDVGVPSLAALQALARERGIASATGGPGTLVLHEGNTMHGSTDNITPWPRTNAFFVYNSVENTPADHPFAAGKFRPD